MSDPIIERINSLGITLPPAPAAVANYVPFVIAGDLLYVSGQVSRDASGAIIAGRLGADLTVDQGKHAARQCALAILAQANAALGGLSRIAGLVRLNGFVNATAEFADHPMVVNGASDLMVDVLGEAGRHTRIAVGVASLPAGCAVEIDAVIRIKTA
ncbi:MAG: RidA family protein [Hyphomicrobiaceae bacterium]|nr:RidA family protein [Hyphomicrobiaceae bacterium]